MGLGRALEKAVVKLARKRVSVDLYKQLGQEVRYGPFKGMKLIQDTNYSQASLGAKATGTYEQSLVAEMLALGPFDDIVDFGAADGYYPVGFLKAGLAKRGFCFEIDPKGREAIVQNARENGVADKIVIEGIADASTPAKLVELGFRAERSLVICDIEGAEHQVFTAEFFAALSEATIVIELHDKVFGQGDTIRRDLIARLAPGRKSWVHGSLPANWAGIPEIEDLPGNERALVCSEGRKGRGEWLIVLPQSSAADS